MTDKKPHLVKLKGATDQTLSKGVGAKLAQQMTTNLGRQYMAIVEVEVDAIHQKEDQDLADLRVLQFWPATGELSHYLRDITAAMHREAGFTAQTSDGDQPLFASGSEPTVEGVLATGGRFAPHPYLASTLSTDDEPVCDVCGSIEDVPVHRVLADGPVDDDPDDEQGDDQGDADAAPDEAPDEEPAADVVVEDPPTDEIDEATAAADAADAADGPTPLRPAPVANPFAPRPNQASGIPDDVA